MYLCPQLTTPLAIRLELRGFAKHPWERDVCSQNGNMVSATAARELALTVYGGGVWPFKEMRDGGFTMEHSTDPASSSVSMALTTLAIHATGASIPVNSELSYRSSDPYAVTMTFFLPDQTVPWIMSRELLAAGTDAPTGAGDVHVRPGSPAGVMVVELFSPHGTAEIRVQTAAVLHFLARTRLLVPVGTESTHTEPDLEKALAALLGTPAPSAHDSATDAQLL